MIVARGLGRRISGASGIIVAAGLGLNLISGGLGGGIPVTAPMAGAVQRVERVRFVFDDADLLEVIPIVVEVINGRR